MVEIRFHGRGGQGVVVGCEILAKALLHEGKYVQYSPDFSTERRGAPVRAFLRVSDKQIYQKDQIYNPDCVVLFNSFSRTKDFISGLKPKGWLIINSPKAPSEFKELGPFRVATVDANEIALKHEIGTQTAPIVNTVMLGAVAKILGVSLDSLSEAIREKFTGERNYLGALEAYEKVRSSG
ncbi:MAG: 2-oxoacid:acceptor oxidoreductase family protein [Dehalococcoidia bacterium]|nr:2-oxoacid:acceptor oxidoreductase family protein [Dehalococcoidia bacterium]